MIDFVREHWLSLISLAVALLGGVPGVITVLNDRKARPKLAAYIHHLMPISSKDAWGESLVGLILHISVGNKGKEALVPLVFQLDCKINGKWIAFESSSIPEGFVVSGPDWQYKYTTCS